MAVGQFTWRNSRKPPPVVPIDPSLPATKSIAEQLMNPAGDYSASLPPIAGYPTGSDSLSLGNIPRMILNNLPGPLVFKGLNALGSGEHALADWATTPEGATQATTGPGPQTSRPFVASLPQPGAVPSPAPLAASAPSGGASQYRNAIAGIESAGSGDYSAVGPQTHSGDRAYGRYQVMGANIPAWTQAALGKAMTPEEFLANPQAQDAVFDHQFGSYLGRGTPQDAASRWFTGRPLAESLNSTDVLGTSGRQYVEKFNNAIGGPPIPPVVQPYTAGAAPQVPNPVDRPAPVGPNFTEQNSWLNEAAPKPTDLGRTGIDRVLSSLASANAGVDTRGPGGFSRLMAAWGAGAAGGQEQADLDKLNAQRDFQQRQSEFALRRAGVAGEQSAATTNWQNNAADIGYQNSAADQGTSFQNAQQGYTTSEANRKSSYDAGNANAQNIYNWQNDAYALSKPKVLSSSYKGVVVQTPDGSIIPYDFSSNDSSYKKSTLPEPLDSAMKYSQLAKTGDVNMVKTEVLRDTVRDGTASQIFGPAYADAVAEATKSVDPSLQAKPELYQKAVQDAVSAYLLAHTQGNDAWIPGAAQMGNIGARMLLPQGQ